MSLADDEEVRRANHEFYRAFEALAEDRMDAAWAHDGAVTCAHPGWPLAVGWSEVRESWRTIFANTADIRFTIEDERIDVRGELAWIVCTERIASGGAEGAVLATNVFRREAGAWKLVHHHGSPFAARVQRPAPPPPPKVLH
ncbi:MAG TPA: nuclear transport factor 2 family protein [Polyangia bacterium]|nr:nuclear transport factor 2 family protein [Polyangia bacterium]